MDGVPAANTRTRELLRRKVELIKVQINMVPEPFPGGVGPERCSFIKCACNVRAKCCARMEGGGSSITRVVSCIFRAGGANILAAQGGKQKEIQEITHRSLPTMS